METYKIYIDAVRQGKNNPIYDISFSHGLKNSVQGVREPLTTGARELAALGLTGRVELWNKNGSYARCGGSIARLAKLTVAENEYHGPRIAKFVEFNMKDES